MAHLRGQGSVGDQRAAPWHSSEGRAASVTRGQRPPTVGTPSVETTIPPSVETRAPSVETQNPPAVETSQRRRLEWLAIERLAIERSSSTGNDSKTGDQSSPQPTPARFAARKTAVAQSSSASRASRSSVCHGTPPDCESTHATTPARLPMMLFMPEVYPRPWQRATPVRRNGNGRPDRAPVPGNDTPLDIVPRP
jgi:hypothetical protein